MAIGRLLKDDPHLCECYDNLTWDGFMKHTSGESPDDMVQYIIESTKRYSKRLGYVSSKVTEHCRYKYTPEYMT